MHLNRIFILSSLASMTFLFLAGAAAFAYIGEISLFGSQQEVLKSRPFPKSETPNVLRLTVAEAGITTVTAQQVQQANIPFNALSADELRLTHEGRPVPFYTQTNGVQPALYFYAQPTTQSPAVYLLTAGKGVAMTQQRAVPSATGSPLAQYHYYWEENSTSLPHTNGDDIWLGPLLLAPDEWSLALNDIKPSGGLGELTIRLWSSTQDYVEPDHHLVVSLNGRVLTHWFWDGVKQETISLALPPGLLSSTDTNVLTLRAPGDTGAAGEAVYLDWIHLSYEAETSVRQGPAAFYTQAETVQVQDAASNLLLFDVTNPHNPLVLQDLPIENGRANFVRTGEVYVALLPSQANQPDISLAPVWKEPLRQPDRGADYIAIVADRDGFARALEPLLTYRQEQGLRVTAVSLSQIYDEFGFGQQSAEAIRHFLTYASQNWQPPAPQYVLLVGDATYDNPGSPGQANLLPTALVHISYNGFVASDTWFALGDGTAPQMAVGRFPAQTASQVATMVRKTLLYESTPPNSHWSSGALLVADDDEPDFDMISDELADIFLANGFRVYDLHMTENDNIRYEVIGAINQGVGFLNYVGHGNERVWGDEFVFAADDVPLLKNQRRLPVFTTFTCSNGAFALPNTTSLAEELLWAEHGGAVAVIAPSGRLLPADVPAVAGAFYTAIFAEEEATVGEALLAAKSGPAEYTHAADVLHLVNLLGDPALTVHKP